MNLFFTGLLIILAGGLISEFVNFKYKGFIFFVFSICGGCLLLYTGILALLNPSFFSAQIILQYPFGKTDLIIDELSAFFIIVFMLIFIVLSFYILWYLKHYNNNKIERLHYINLSLLVISMLILFAVRNTFVFLFAWEIMSISSFFLVTFENEKKEVYDAAINYLVAMHIGFLFLVAAFAYISFTTGDNSFDGIKLSFKNSSLPTVVFLFIFIFCGFGTKAGFFPFHAWLPKAHPAAPSHVSALMSALMLKTGIYGIIRIITLIENPPVFIGYLILSVSVITAVFGIIYAVNEKDIKKQLAFSSIENIGILGTGIGIGVIGMSTGNKMLAFLGFGGAFFHIFNHALFKSLLFMISGVVYVKTHTKNMDELGGIIKILPATSAFFVLGSAAIAGLPPLNGFAGEFLIYLGLLSGAKANFLTFIISIIVFAILSLIGALAIIAFTKTTGVVFLGIARDKSRPSERIKESPFILIPMFILSAVIILTGLFPQVLLSVLYKPMELIIGGDIHSYFAKTSIILNNYSTGVLIFTGILLFVIFLRVLMLKIKKPEYENTWGCGYNSLSGKVQYTASSFSDDVSNLSRPILITKKEVTFDGKIFPLKSNLGTKNFDITDIIFDKFIFFPIKKVLDLVSIIQSRTAQQYVLYVIIFIVINFFWIIGVK